MIKCASRINAHRDVIKLKDKNSANGFNSIYANKEL